MTRRLLALLLLVSSCTAGAPESERLLPPVQATAVPVGDVAGPKVRSADRIANPFADDARARADGNVMYRSMNCAYCHGIAGEGGMGPSLIDGEWLFGDAPIDRFMSVYGGRARGMPAFGGLLPEEAVWKIVAYLESLNPGGGEPGRPGGRPAEATRESQGPQAYRK